MACWTRFMMVVDTFVNLVRTRRLGAGDTSVRLSCEYWRIWNDTLLNYIRLSLTSSFV